MSHNPVKTLMDEHEFIASAQTIVRKLKNLWESDPDAYREALDKLLDFFVRYSDGFHHHKEEEVLFPQMRDHPGFMLGDILQELEEHHDAFREFVQDIRAAAGSGEFKGAQDLLEKYMEQLLDHIAIENDELFIMAENLFSSDELERMYFLFEDVDAELGRAQKEQLVSGLKELENSIPG
ncbi:MAG: hypothetical protein JPMHGGIA_02577 [Saprospiraceae bacterium]|jgi:hemerythrin-like domain-containing protein|nr:hypothetical protein [Saprospiraceae bacterium]